MASVLPPPAKRQRRENLERTQKQQDVSVSSLSNAGSFRLRFVAPDDGTQMGSTVEIQLADATGKNLNLLLNTMLGRDKQDFIRYRFTFNHPISDDEEVCWEYSGKPQDLLDFFKRHKIEDDRDSLKSLTPKPEAVFRVQLVRRLAHRIPGHHQPILAAKFGPASSDQFATASSDGTARIWDTLTGTQKYRLASHSGSVKCLAWSPDGEMLATGGSDTTVRIWDPTTGKSISGKPFKGHKSRVSCLAWQPYHLWRDGSARLASSSKDESIRIWIVNSGVTEHVLGGHTKAVSMIKWGGLDWIYSSSQDSTVRVWDAAKGTLIHKLSDHSSRVNAISLSTDFVLRTGFFDPSGVPATTTEKVEEAKDRFCQAARGDEGNGIEERLVSAGDDGTLHLYRLSMDGEDAKVEHVQKLVGHQNVVGHVAFSPNGKVIASTSFDKHAKLWIGRTGEFIHTLVGHVASVYFCEFSADSRFLVTASRDTTLKVWSMATHKMVSDLPGHEDEVFAVDWSPDGQRIGSGGRDGVVRLWRN